MYHDNDLMIKISMEAINMFKKIMAIILALSMAICLAACGNNSSQSETDDNQSSTSGASETTPVGEPEGNESEKTEEPTFELSGEGKSMSELLAEANPANKYEELAAAHKICQSRFDLAVVSTEKAGLTEDSTMSGLLSGVVNGIGTAMAGNTAAQPATIVFQVNGADLVRAILPDLRFVERSNPIVVSGV